MVRSRVKIKIKDPKKYKPLDITTKCSYYGKRDLAKDQSCTKCNVFSACDRLTSANLKIQIINSK